MKIKRSIVEMFCFIVLISFAFYFNNVEAKTPALVRVHMSASVGVLLEEVPRYLRDTIAEEYLQQDNDFWIERAKKHIDYTWYYLTWRQYYVDEGQMLPPVHKDAWRVTITSPPRRQRIKGHSHLLRDYFFETYIVTNEESLILSEPSLAEIGSHWEHTYIVPLDPEHIFQRTGYACMDEYEFPPGAVDSENARFFFDQECAVEEGVPTFEAVCHYTMPQPTLSCFEALKKHTGFKRFVYNFDRVEWDEDIASQFRVGSLSGETSADVIIQERRLAVNRVDWEYFDPEDCALVENCISGTGWRRLLRFDSSTVNVGKEPLHVGSIGLVGKDPDPNSLGLIMAKHNVYEWSPCHRHWHFQFYADYSLDDMKGRKQGWCMESINREVNHEDVDLVTVYSNCSYQGISSGWADEYVAGIDCQWIDITSITEESDKSLNVEINPAKFLCEGEPVYDRNGKWKFEPTNYTTQVDGLPIDRPKCHFGDGVLDNNLGSTPVHVPASGSRVTEPCKLLDHTYIRDCGWTELPTLYQCTAGQRVDVSLTYSDASNPQVLRICEGSAKLNRLIACEHKDDILSSYLLNIQTTVTFTCPVARDTEEVGGVFTILVGSLFTSKTVQDIQVTIL